MIDLRFHRAPPQGSSTTVQRRLARARTRRHAHPALAKIASRWPSAPAPAVSVAAPWLPRIPLRPRLRPHRPLPPETPESSGSDEQPDRGDVTDGRDLLSCAGSRRSGVRGGRRSGVGPGDTLSIIEAMKLMNELECEVSGTVRRDLRRERAAGRVRPGSLPRRPRLIPVRVAGWASPDGRRAISGASDRCVTTPPAPQARHHEAREIGACSRRS